MHLVRPQSKQPIPRTAKKVFSGILFDVYQWEQEQFDGTKKVFEKIKRQDTAGVIPITNDKKILITVQEQPGTDPFIGLPGGIIDKGEDPLIAAKRELLEETGYTSDSWELFHSIQPISKIDWTLYLFIARNCKKTTNTHLDSGEKMKIEAISWEELLQIIVKEEFRDHELALLILRNHQLPHGEVKLKEQILRD